MTRPSPTRRIASSLVLFLLLAGGLLWLNNAKEASQEPVSLAEASKADRPHVRSSFSKDQGEQALARHEFELMRLRDPATGQIPPDIRERELALARTLPRANQIAGKSATEQWALRGPSHVGGRTRALGVDLDYNGSSNQRILAGGISGGMYLSEDGGQNWTLASNRTDIANVSSLVQDPVNRNTWYFGTGEFTGNSAGGGLQQFYGHGIFKSTDSGRTWSPLLSTREGGATMFDSFFDYVWNLAMSPNGDVLYAATFGGIQRSTDGGNSWQAVAGAPSGEQLTQITDVVVASDGDVYATLSRSGSGNATYGVFKSTNQGTNWQNISPPDLTNDPYRMVVATAPSDPNTVYLIVQTNQAGDQASAHQLFRYNDASQSWTNLSSAIPDEQGASGNATFSSQGGYDLLLRVKPDDPEVVFIGGTNLYRSTNGGSSFTRIGGYATPDNYSAFKNHHSDQHALAFYPNNPNEAISGSDGGLSKTTNVLAEPHNWTFINNGYVTTQFYDVAIDPQAGGQLVLGGLQDNGTWGAETNKPEATWFDLFGGDGGYAAITPGGTTLYLSSQQGNVFRLTNSGYSAVAPAGGQNYMFITPYRLDPNDPRVMYLAESGGVWRNSNLDDIPNGNQQPTSTNWTFLSNSALSGLSTSTLTIAKTPANRLYFGATNFQSQTRLVRVDNAQTNPSGVDITPPVTSQGFAPYPSSIGVNPNNGDEIIATFSNYQIQSIWYSTNGGTSWTNIDGNLAGDNGPSIRNAAIMPTASGTMYFIATSTGVYSATSMNGNSTSWALEADDVIGNVVVDMLATRPEDGTIVAGTHGRGVYQATVGTGGSGAAVAAFDVNEVKVEVQPGATATTTFTLTNTGAAPLSYNMGAAGKKPVLKYQLTPDFSLKRPSEQAATHTPDSRAKAQGLAEAQGPVAPAPLFSQTGPDTIVLDDGNSNSDDFWGWGDGFTPLQWGNRFVAPVGGFSLETVQVYMRTETLNSNEVQLYITDPDGNTFISGAVTLGTDSNGGWFEISFTNPIILTEGQVFDIEFVASGAILFPAGVDTDARVSGNSFYWFPSGLSGFYVNLSDEIGSGFENGAFLIRANGTAGSGSTNQPPNAVIQASKTTATPSENITFNASSSSDPDGSIVQYAWNFGDGATSTQQSTSHAYASTGSFTVTLTVTDDQGATDQATTQITIGTNNKAPIANIQASAIQAQINEAITFDASNSKDDDGTIAGYAWNFGDGATSTQQVAQHAFSQAGAVTVSLTVTDNEGATGQASVQITILAAPSRLAVSPQSGTLNPGDSQTITVTYNATDLAPGSYAGEITFASNGGNFNIPVDITVGTSVDTEQLFDLPEAFTLEQNYPNPFNPSTTIAFTMKEPGSMRLTVFDLNGRVIRMLADGQQPAGVHRIQWDGRDSNGRLVASGTYFYRLDVSAGTHEAIHYTRKMLLVK